MQEGVDPKAAVAVIALITALIALATAILNMANAQAKEAATPQAKRGVYRNVLGWVETALWAAGIPVSWFAGLDLTLMLWLVAYCFGIGLFLSGSNPKTLRVEIFRLVFSAQSLVILFALASDTRLLELTDRLSEVIARLVDAWAPK